MQAPELTILCIRTLSQSHWNPLVENPKSAEQNLVPNHYRPTLSLHYPNRHQRHNGRRFHIRDCLRATAQNCLPSRCEIQSFDPVTRVVAQVMRFPQFFNILVAVVLISRNASATGSDWAEAPKPPYPLNAALEGTTGEVTLRVVVNNDGHVREAGIVKSSGKKELDYAARASVLKWRLNRARIRPGDLSSGREVIVDFRETEKERHVAAAVLRRASSKGSAWKSGGFFTFPPDAIRPEAQRTARIRFTIDKDGHPRAVQIVESSGSAKLDEAAVKGIQTWTAYPEWVGESAEVPVTFETSHGGAFKKGTSEWAPTNWQGYITYHPVPEYPFQARAQHMTGSGLYMITFSPDGHAEKVEILQTTGSALLDSSVVQAFQRWRAVANAPFSQAKIPVTFLMGRAVSAGNWRMGQPELIGARR